MTQENFEHSFFIVKNDADLYFAGFNSEQNKAEFVKNPYAAKMFISKSTIKLRPNETIVEVYANLGPDSCSLSAPFRPKRRLPQK